jgi:hypothetical protein
MHTCAADAEVFFYKQYRTAEFSRLDSPALTGRAATDND